MKRLKWNRKLSILVLIMFITVTFASFNTNLFIDGKAYVRVDRDIRITNIHLLETEYDGYENVGSEYSNRTISTDVSLPRQASSVTYEVTISNVSDRRYKISDIIEDSYNNKDVKYELIDASIGNIVEPHTKKTFKVKFTNNVTVVEEDDVTQTFIYNFEYTGEEQEFVVPFDGEYTLEVWGAQGGNAKTEISDQYYGGYGGYSKGKISLQKNNKLFINIGGAGITNTSAVVSVEGGYNGGGPSGYNSNVWVASSGGGATSISYLSGLLKTQEKSKGTLIDNKYYSSEKIIIVAGGGGGACAAKRNESLYGSGNGGSGGGIKGAPGETNGNTYRYPVGDGGTQTKSPEFRLSCGTSGFGSYITSRPECGHGAPGGGFYAGNAGSGAAGGGGSGYIANPNLSDKVMYCYNCEESEETQTKTIETDNHSSTPTSNYAKEGSGYARMTVTHKIVDGDSYYYDYTGGQQTFTTPYSGLYQLETWGAQGGYHGNGRGGFGGYSRGNINLDKNQLLYITVGGTDYKNCDDSTTGFCAGGYNGGGKSRYASGEKWGSGGGATHISTVTGLLSSLSENKDSIIIVSGGGGGAYNQLAGSGGGFIGVNGHIRDGFTQSLGGTQSAGGSGYKNGSFGQGGDCTGSNCAGGGGGYYGGAGGSGLSAAGGSGYIGNELLKDKIMYCYNCDESQDIGTRTVSTQSHSKYPKLNQAKEGNGYSKITLLKRTINQTKLTLDFTFEEYVNGNEYTFGFTGSEQSFTVPKTGIYKVELWGAQGGYAVGSNGGYTSGKIKLNKGEVLYINVGERSLTTNGTSFNGGQASASGQPGGGATDIRLVSGENSNSVSLNSRIMVAGGGGASRGSTSNLGYGGGLHGGVSYRTTVEESNWSSPATQTSSGVAVHTCSKTYPSGFGIGGSCAGGGGGYYGGSGNSDANGGGSGGSSFISGHNGCVAITSSTNRTPRNDSNGIECVDGTTDITCSKHYSNYVFTDTVMIDGAGYSWTTERSSEYSGMPTTDGSTTMVGNTGNGFAKITCLEETTDYEFDYTGDSQEFVAPYNGVYKVELWGASGAPYGQRSSNTNLGGYTSGTIKLNKNEKLYLYVGGEGNELVSGWNGGAAGGTSSDGTYYAGGGSTDVRLESGEWNNFNSLKSRIMVASSAGGSGNYSGRMSGGAGGGLVGYEGESSTATTCSIEVIPHALAVGGSQISGGLGMKNNYVNGGGEFGFAKRGTQTYGTAGGSGYFGGGTGGATNCFVSAGAGGSSYISGHPGCVSVTQNSTSDNISFVNDSNGIACNSDSSSSYNALGYNTDSLCSKHYSGKVFTNTVMIDGQGYIWDANGKANSAVGMPTHDGRTTMVGNVGNGYARITLIEKRETYNINYDLDGGSLNTPKKTYSTFEDNITLGNPTKEGYTFIGWLGGKNIVDAIEEFNNISETQANGLKYLILDVKPNTKYTMSTNVPRRTEDNGCFLFIDSSNTINNSMTSTNNGVAVGKPMTFTSTSEGKILIANYATSSYRNYINTGNYWIQLEEGDEATSYEPFISTPIKNLTIPSGSNGNRTYTAFWRDDSLLCRKATTLHSTACNWDNSEEKGCSGASYEYGDSITYGSIVSDTLKAGDAFDCDVNGDGIFDSENERFYYLNDLAGNTNYAVLLYSNVVKNGVKSNSYSYIAWGVENANNLGPTVAIGDLPTTSQWSNVSLSNTSRQLVSDTNELFTTAGDNAILDYSGKSARLPTYNEVRNACGVHSSKLNEYCEYIFEGTSYDGTLPTGNYGFWLESPMANSATNVYHVNSHWMKIANNYSTVSAHFMIKPVIEVPKSKLRY